ncbi:hypothetical protein RRG08_035511 [Elysia crispata]|uniref:Uncharacterized protein n=1 Tax=Elysia crispata TaxID=231223 RepID=A0AAE1A3K5_9GAST|nr:hypothetical protein RRG08_035511 [Elysia crispata]
MWSPPPNVQTSETGLFAHQSVIEPRADEDVEEEDEYLEDISQENLDKLRTQVELMRNKSCLEDGTLNNTDDNDSLRDFDEKSSDDFELGNDDLCDTDTDWSDSDLQALGLRCSQSVKREKELLSSDSDSDIPLANLKSVLAVWMKETGQKKFVQT